MKVEPAPSLRYLSALVESLPGAAVFVVDHALRYELAGGEAIAAAGLRSEDFVGRTIHEVLPPSLAAQYESHYRQALGGRPFQYEHSAHGRHYLTRGVPLRDGHGGVTAALAVSYDVTDRVRAEREVSDSIARRTYRSRLADVLRDVDDPIEVQKVAARFLGEQLDVARVAYGEVSSDGSHVDIARNHLAHGASAVVGRFRMGDFGERLLETLRGGRPLVVRDVAAEPAMTPSERAAFDAMGVSSLVNVPLIKSGRFVAALLVHDRRPRAWTDAEVALIDETAERTWAAVERARAESARRRAELGRTQAMAAARLGSWETDVASGRTVWDERTAELLGVPVDRRDEFANRWIERVHPDDRPKCVEQMSRALREGVDLDLEIRAITFDGRHRWFRSMASVVRDEAGTPARIVGITQDITDRKEAEAVLRDSEARFRVMADGIPLIVWVVDAGGRVQFVNRAYTDFFGVTEAQVQGPNWQPLVHPDDLSSYTAALMAALDEQRRFEARTRVRRADGEWRWLHSYGAPRFDELGRFIGMAGSSADITSVVDAERMLREDAQRKDEFLAMLSHELRGPLAPLRTALSIFDRESLSERGRHALGVSQRQLRQLVTLVEDLLQASRALQGKIEIKPEPVLVQHVVEAAAEAAEPLIAERRQRIAFDLPVEPVKLDADPVRLAQIVENLLTNASKYSDAGSTIDVGVFERRDRVEISVRDRGVGIAPADLPRLFIAFSQIDATIDRSRGGLGLGLAVVKQLAELHGGSVTVTSAGLGAGSTFTVAIPRVRVDA